MCRQRRTRERKNEWANISRMASRCVCPPPAYIARLNARDDPHSSSTHQALGQNCYSPHFLSILCFESHLLGPKAYQSIKKDKLSMTESKENKQNDAHSNKKRKTREEEASEQEETATKSSENKKEKHLLKKQRKEEKHKILETLPKVDPETGLAFTKSQIRRMRKRVQRGLAPIETPQEMHQRLQQEKELQYQEECALLGIETEKQDESEITGDMTSTELDPSSTSSSSPEETTTTGQEDFEPKIVKTSATKKPVPEDYVCSACQNQHTPRHWIYDCPDKIHKHSQHQNNKKRVYVTGLPFHFQPKDVRQLFHKYGMKHCHLRTFPDNPSRCNGTAILTFATIAQAQEVISQLNGISIPISATKNKGDSNNNQNSGTRAELKLKLSQVVPNSKQHRKRTENRTPQ